MRYLRNLFGHCPLGTDFQPKIRYPSLLFHTLDEIVISLAEIASRRKLMIASDFALFAVTVKPGLETFGHGELVLASSDFKSRNGARVYYCATAQPAAFRTYLSISAEVESYEEL